MDEDEVRTQFASRVHELCDELGIPQGHGRQTALGKRFGVTPKAARKWLMGLAFPELALAVRMCTEAQVNVNWLLQGAGPKRGDRADADSMRVAEGIQSLPTENRHAVLEYLRYEFERADGWFTEEALARYLDSIDEIKRRGGNVRGAPLRT